MALPYQDPGVIDPYSGTYTAYPSWVDSGSDFGGGWSQTLQDMSKLFANTWAQSYLMQKTANGAAYLEGQRIAAQQAQARSLTGGFPLLWLIGGAVLVYMLAKD